VRVQIAFLRNDIPMGWWRLCMGASFNASGSIGIGQRNAATLRPKPRHLVTRFMDPEVRNTYRRTAQRRIELAIDAEAQAEGNEPRSDSNRQNSN
jgi:hypothetical protein